MTKRTSASLSSLADVETREEGRRPRESGARAFGEPVSSTAPPETREHPAARADADFASYENAVVGCPRAHKMPEPPNFAPIFSLFPSPRAPSPSPRLHTDCIRSLHLAVVLAAD